ncbi:hypothetical protein [Actinomadura sp. WMMB 499]|uniref:hypothetical protein n=1 Tax=Actinomadura sp. WMMB 499 TaxID=1219491 RepID=UPI00124461CB|nr:hypothetical protein [Actinomadura sp. WMMB 499]QFG24354.1 hypothetical protein F7P10_27720 [Actinomadura sp. WMMB 499]
MGRSGTGADAANREGAGLPRPPEPFERVYSAPDPPSQARRPRLLVLLAAVVVAGGVAGGAVLALRSGGEPDAAAPRTSAPTAPGSGAAPSRSAPSPAGGAPIAALPEPCGTVTDGTVRRLIPDARQRDSANSTLTTCTYESTGGEPRSLLVQAHLYAPANTDTPVEDARRYFDAGWRQAHDAPVVRTFTLERQPGIGDEAYRWFKRDEGQPTVVGQLTVRTRNAVITVSYSEPGEGTERERECLDAATGVAREVLTSLQF